MYIDNDIVLHTYTCCYNAKPYPPLFLPQDPGAPLSGLLVAMFREVCARQATLVAHWMRVGYCQGNMNSDNSALCGVTLDYGPFGFMEKFNPAHCPWVGGGIDYAFARQPQAIAINLSILAQAFTALLQVRFHS